MTAESESKALDAGINPLDHRAPTGTLAGYVVNCREAPFDVYIGRPSKWGNPFTIGKDGDRASVIRKYLTYLRHHPNLVSEARKELKGKVLGCYCSPLPCHGDLLAAVANDD